MAHPTIVDMLSRTTGMADAPKKKAWIKKAVPDSRKGVFKAKAEAAGKSTREYAAEKAGAPGELGREARLAKTLMGMHGKSTKKSSKSSKIYEKSRSKMEA